MPRRRLHLTTASVGLALGLLAVAAPARAADEPGGGCYPACRTGYFCKAGQCESLCNPPCPINQRCTPEGECEALNAKGRARKGRNNYFGIFGGYRPALNDDAIKGGELRLEFGSRYGAMQIGPVFGELDGGQSTISLRSAIFGQFPFRLTSRFPLYLVPTVALGYSFTWVDDPVDTKIQDVFISPGLRVRYDVIPRLALFLNLIEVEINFLRLQGNRNTDFQRVRDTVPLNWSLSAGAAFLY